MGETDIGYIITIEAAQMGLYTCKLNTGKYNLFRVVGAYS